MQTPAQPSAKPTGLQPPALTELMRAPAAQVPVTVGLIVLNQLVFVALAAAGGGWWHAGRGVQLDWGANFAPATQDGQWWRLGSAMFIHFGIWHLLLNMWALWDIGRLLEGLLGRWRFALLYLGAGVCGNLVSLVVQGNRAVSGGASGAVFGLYGALLVFLWVERRQVEAGEFRWLFGGALGFSVLMLGLGWFMPGIDNAAHGGGLLAGMLWAGLLLRPWTASSPAAGVRPGLSATLLVVAVVLLGLVLPEPAYRFGEEVKARQSIQRFISDDERIHEHWNSILNDVQKNSASFESIAGRMDAEVVQPYRQSFEDLMRASPESAAPSAATLANLQAYAAQKASQAQKQVDALRQGNKPELPATEPPSETR
ncbi:rhomboid family intramembrane serine protease [Rhodoferax sp. TBRC 17660]|uniref:Rhomboid family intramembrane serine protease n=1 Tax=Rhodoferax potami TaxID=3068338 RepID=A0ABU3KIE7_9BURK|nr:rhomboid family intramembrane serine protease [Rhodoferax sp. TBRC 17660]MDT7517555.1 rhomboid family intramembrane serine protease [Rhodoferax sp. TBRC 17660]